MSLFTPEALRTAEVVLQGLRARNLTLTTAESCTGGLLSALLTEIPGSSDVFTHGYVTYANAAKTAMIGVTEARIRTHGAVSEDVARAMAEGALQASGAAVSIAITGIAGPTGATRDKPVGLVHVARGRAGFSTVHQRHVFPGDRSAVRLQAVMAALELLQQQWQR
ncbi:MAG: CinA family protein [Alphaproteobacteria bacterium]|nr:CinA family protein [Alphaproteobacteria bacterium]